MAPTRVEDILKLGEPDPEYAEMLKNGPAFPQIEPEIGAYRRFGAQMRPIREAQAGPPIPNVIEEDHHVSIRDGTSIIVRSYIPQQAPEKGSPLIVYFHGGGFCIGDLLTGTPLCRTLALKLGAVVLNVAYRLAPEHPFPIPIYDCWDALLWAAKNAGTLKATPDAGFIVGGESAGGNISAVLAHMAIDEKLSPSLTGQFLSAATFFGRDNVPGKYKDQYLSYEQNKSSSILTEAVHDMFMKNYNPDHNSPLRSPYYHPGGHLGQPPAYFQVCGADIARDSGLIYERTLREEYDIQTRLDIYPGLPHVFFNYFHNLSATKKYWTDTVEGFQWLLSQ